MPASTAHRGLTHRWLCRALSPLADRALLRVDVPAGEHDCERLFSLGGANLVLPRLYQVLRESGLLARFPDDFSQALEGFDALHGWRVEQLQRQKREVTALLNRHGVVPVWLKGATGLLEASGPPSSRMMLDLDFWIPDPAQHQTVLEALTQAGYRMPEGSVEYELGSSHHFVPRFRDGEAARLEIHHHLVALPARPLLDDESAWPAVEWLDWEGLKIGRLCALDRLRHSYIQCTEMNSQSLERGKISLMKALDFLERYLAASHEDRASFLKALEGERWRSAARRFFSFLDGYFGLASPVGVDRGYLRRVAFEVNHPQAAYLGFLVVHAGRVLRSGRAGHWSTWWPKLAQHLKLMGSLA